MEIGENQRANSRKSLENVNNAKNFHKKREIGKNRKWIKEEVEKI